MMHSFEVPDEDPAGFVDRVRAELRRRELDGLVSLCLEAHEIVVRFTKFGTTELRFRVSSGARGFRADLGESRIAPLHSAFQAAFEDKFENMIQGVGARLV